MFDSINISTSGIVAQRQRMDTISANIANVNTTRDVDGNTIPFQRRFVTFAAAQPVEGTDGLSVMARVETDTESPARRVHEPGHPDADADGYVEYPNVDLITEFVNAMEASRAYEANVAALEMSKEMMNIGMTILA